jgi:hypothetical protein
MAKAVAANGDAAKPAAQTSRATASQPNRTGMMQTGGQQGRAIAPRR